MERETYKIYFLSIHIQFYVFITLIKLNPQWPCLGITLNKNTIISKYNTLYIVLFYSFCSKVEKMSSEYYSVASHFAYYKYNNMSGTYIVVP